MSTKLLVILIMVFNAFISAGGQFFLKLGMNEIAKMGKLAPLEFLIRTLTTPLVPIGVAIYGVSLLIWLFVLSKVELSFAYALVALTFIFLLVFSKLFLHENIGPLRIFGSLIIIVGIIFVAKS